MSRNLASANASAVTASVVEPVYFLEMNFDDLAVRVHTQIGTVTWGGHDWIGVGSFGGVSTVEENSDLSRRTITYSLSGIPGDMVSIVLGENYQGRTANLYLGFIDRDTGVLVATPELMDQGRMDIAEIQEGDSFTVTLNAESRFAAWNRPVVRRYNNADQQARFPGDRGLEFIEQAADKQIIWGARS